MLGREHGPIVGCKLGGSDAEVLQASALGDGENRRACALGSSLCHVNDSERGRAEDCL